MKETRDHIARSILSHTALQVANDYKLIVQLRAVCMSLNYPGIGDLLRKTCVRCINKAMDWLSGEMKINRYKAKKNGAVLMQG